MRITITRLLKESLTSLMIPLIAFVASTCGGGSKPTTGEMAGQSAFPIPISIFKPASVALTHLLNELGRLEAPTYVDAGIFGQIKNELQKELSEKGVSKFVSKPPTGEANRVDDLTLIDNGDGTYTLSWTYKNLGDYNQDGIVNIFDIFPLADHFFESSSPENSWIDGDKSGKIDLGDIFPLADNFYSQVSSYAIETGTSPDGPFEAVASVNLGEARESAPKSFAVSLELPPGEFIRVVPADAKGEMGIPSEPLEIPEPNPAPRIVSVSPTRGITGEPVTFSALVHGLKPLSYSWSFGEAVISVDDPNSPNPSGFWGEPGTYESCTLTVTNSFGQDTKLFTLTVEEYTSGRGDWWMFGREPTHNRRSTILGAQSGSLKWRAETGWITQSSPAIASDGTIYIGSGDNYLYAFNPDGSLKWKCMTSLGAWLNSSPAIGQDGTIYVCDSGGELNAIRPNGTLKWQYDTGDTGALSVSSPAIDTNGIIYVGGWDFSIHAVNPNGTRLWAYKTGEAVDSSPAIGPDGTIYCGSGDGYLYALTPSGNLKWKTEVGPIGCSSPAVSADGTIYIGSSDGYLYAINPDGTMKWRYETGFIIDSSPAISADGTIYVGSRDSFLYAINSDGTLKWRFMTLGEGEVNSSPAIGADGTIYVGSDDWYFYAINPDGSLKWSYLTGGKILSSPAIGPGGAVYVGSADFSLYAFAD